MQVFVIRGGQRYRMDARKLAPVRVAAFQFRCRCGREFPTSVEITTHLRWAERRPHEKHKRVP